MLERLKLQNLGPAPELELRISSPCEPLYGRQWSRQDVPAGHGLVVPDRTLASRRQPAVDGRIPG